MCFQVKCKDCKKASWAVSFIVLIDACLFVIFERKGVSPHFPKQNYFPIVCYTRMIKHLLTRTSFSHIIIDVYIAYDALQMILI